MGLNISPHNHIQTMRTNVIVPISLVLATYLIIACSEETDFHTRHVTSGNQTIKQDTSAIQMQDLPQDPPFGSWGFANEYIVGGGYSTRKDLALLWIKGWPKPITDGVTDAIATSIFISGDDVFIAGYEYEWDTYHGFYYFPNKAIVWKNGVAQPLTQGTHEAGAFSIFIWEQDVYVAGYESNGVNLVAKVWKNGVPANLSDGSIDTYVTSMFVSDGDVYVVGYEYLAGYVEKAILWKNGVPQQLGGEAIYTSANSVFVSGMDVYVAGRSEKGAIIWKNGEAQQLSDRKNSWASSIFVESENIYISGSELTELGDNSYGASKAVIWKNGVQTDLTSGEKNAGTTSITVYGDDVYMTGYIGENAVIWKNGIAKSLGVGSAKGIFIPK